MTVIDKGRQENRPLVSGYIGGIERKKNIKYTWIYICILAVVCLALGAVACYLWMDGRSPEAAEEPHPLDYLHEEYFSCLDSAASNVESSQISYDYAEKWDAVAAEYYDAIMSVANDDLKAALKANREAWELYAQAELELFFRYKEQKYWGGSVVPVLVAEEQYRMSRERALELYDIFIQVEDTERPVID